jgi:hypothetical protein
MKIIWNQKVGIESCPYLIRWGFVCKVFSIRLHKWISSDDKRYFHDHPWWYISLVMSGFYIDKSPDGKKLRKPGSVKFNSANHKHTVLIPKRGCWTIILTGPEIREWGFWVGNKFKKRNRYFYDLKHHQCNEGKTK